MARTIRDKLDGIVTYWTFCHISNAKMEGFNNKIRGLIKQAYGFRDREYNKIENLSTAGNLKREINMSFCHKPSKRPKKPVGLTGVDLLKNPLYTSGVRRLCFIFETTVEQCFI